MKKLLTLLLLCVFMLPTVVKADRDLDGEVKLYIEETDNGTTAVFKYRAVCGNECDEVITYDKDVLEYISIDASFPRWENNNIATPSVKVTNNDSGTLKYDYTLIKNNEDQEDLYSLETEILVRFKVLSTPSDGKIKVTATALDDKGNEIVGLKNNLEVKTSSSKECNCPKCEQVESKTECPKKEKTTDIWFIIGIISLILNGLLLIFTIILLAKNINKSKYINILKNKE